MEKTICDRCNNYEVSAGGCLTKCHEVQVEPFSMFLPEYFFMRESGEKKTCKRFAKLPSQPEN